MKQQPESKNEDTGLTTTQEDWQISREGITECPYFQGRCIITNTVCVTPRMYRKCIMFQQR